MCGCVCVRCVVERGRKGTIRESGGKLKVATREGGLGLGATGPEGAEGLCGPGSCDTCCAADVGVV
jgi:hypothetical protein